MTCFFLHSMTFLSWPAPCLLRPTGRKQRPFQTLGGPPTNPPRPLWRTSQPQVRINHYCSMSWPCTEPLNYTMWHVCCAWAPSQAAATIRRFPSFAVCPPKHNAAKTKQCRSHGTGSPARRQSKAASQFIFKIEKRGKEKKKNTTVQKLTFKESTIYLTMHLIISMYWRLTNNLPPHRRSTNVTDTERDQLSLFPL